VNKRVENGTSVAEVRWYRSTSTIEGAPEWRAYVACSCLNDVFEEDIYRNLNLKGANNNNWQLIYTCCRIFSYFR
jgi:sarcosine oxidase delta subunit